MAGSTCAVCGIRVKNGQEAIGCESNCERWFHIQCINMSRKDYKDFCGNQGKQWMCNRKDCCAPPNLEKLVQNMEIKITNIIEEKVSATCELLRKENEDVRRAADYMNTAFEELKAEVIAFKDKYLSKDNSAVLAEMKTAVDHNAQYQRRNNLKIEGIQYADNEDLFKVVCDVAKVLQVPLTHQEIDVVHRLPSKPGQIRPILVKFVCRWKKEGLLQAIRNRRGLDTQQLGFPGPKRNIYLGDHLTAHNAALAKKARDLKNAGIVYSTWTRDCKIYVRVNEGEPKAIVITGDECLTNIRSQASGKSLNHSNSK